ncbi:MAG: radical SAM protein [Deltaproteobacteria bacterium]|nr:MAG: radical SAM protein [Deltaproteobacteria bacterium]
MKPLRIVMIEPRSSGEHVFSRYVLPRLGLPVLAKVARRLGHRPKVFIEQHVRATDGDIAGADIVFVSTITATAPAAYRIAERARRAGKPVVMGGPHVTFLDEEALEHCDYVVRGEGELVLSALLEMLQGKVAPEQVPGLSWKLDGKVMRNLFPPPVAMDEVPPIDVAAMEGRFGMWFPRGVLPVQTSRGCPHRCKFCSVTPVFGHRLRFASPEKVADDLERLRGLGDKLFFYDDNFCASPGRTKRLLEYLLANNVFLPPWTAQVSVRAARDEEMLALMSRAGCRTVFVGFESVNPETLDAFRKDQKLEDIRLAVEKFHRYGIRVHGMFVVGADADDRSSVSATAAFCKRTGIDTVQILVLTPLPGTEVFEELQAQGRLITRDWSLYDAHHAVFRPARMRPDELTKAAFAAMKKFYARSRLAAALLRADFYRAALGLYARRQLRRWIRRNRRILRQLRRIPALEAG